MEVSATIVYRTPSLHGDRLQYPRQMSHDIRVPEAQDEISFFLQESRARLIEDS
jgi:hypothetical protein